MFLQCLSGGTFPKFSQGAEPVRVNVYGAQESIPPAYLAWRAGTTNGVVVPVRQAGNRLLGSLKCFQIRALTTPLNFLWTPLRQGSLHLEKVKCPLLPTAIVERYGPNHINGIQKGAANQSYMTTTDYSSAHAPM
jgi:hypothetical protein